MRVLAWILQILILGAGIHVFLRFVRTTRGDRLIRGLLLAGIVGFIGLWGLSKVLDLEELGHILKGATGFIVVAFVIVFQPELRRAMARLGEHSLVGRLMKPPGPDTILTVVRAARSLAKRRIGALVAFEREMALGPFVEAGTELDSGVTARLLESIFYPGTALHDGGVLVRRDRIAAAGCFFPLPQEGVLDPRLGTRHRAALGLTEVTDAVVLVVSEETGTISLAKGGRIHLDVPPDGVEEELRKLMEGVENGSSERARPRAAATTGWKRDLAWLPVSLLLAAGILFVAHRDIRVPREFSVRVTGVTPSEMRQPRNGEILVVLPGEGHQLLPLAENEPLRVAVTGSRSQIEEVEDGLRGVYEVSDPAMEAGPLELDDVRWRPPVLGLDYEWVDDRSPVLRIGRFETRRVALEPEEIPYDPSGLNPRYELRVDAIRFEPEASVVLRGPAAEVPAPGEPVRELLEPIVLTEEDKSDVHHRLRLDEAARERGFSLESSVFVVLPIAPARRDVGTVTKEIALTSLDPSRAEEAHEWALPAHAQTARFTIQASGLIPVNVDPGSPALLERFQTIKRFVEENLLVYVDVSEMSPESNRVNVRYVWRRDWRKALDSLVGIEKGSLGDRESLDVRLESEKEILLERRPQDAAAETDEAGSGSGM